MKLLQIIHEIYKERRTLIVQSLVVCALGVLFIMSIIRQTDQAMRVDMLVHIKQLAVAIDIDHIRALTGTIEDLNNSSYQKLKAQIASICSVKDKCRFGYLMGQKPSGEVFFFVDSEPSGSKDEIPPGQAYSEITSEALKAFNTLTPMTLGPVTDSWGTFISVGVPIIDPKNGKLAAVLGFDYYANDWNWKIAEQAALPIGLLISLMLVILAILVISKNISPSSKPIMGRLLPFLTILILLLVAGGAFLMWNQHNEFVTGRSLLLSNEIKKNFTNALKQQSQGLGVTGQSIALDPRVIRAVKKRDTFQLQKDWSVVNEKIHKDYSITHFYFFDSKRVCLLRLHRPDFRGDTINRFTALEAERSQAQSWGIELGPMGTFTLRMVTPIFDEKKIIGYVELGKEIEDIWKSLNLRSDIKIEVNIKKEFVKRESWEAGMKMLERPANWDNSSDSVLIYTSLYDRRGEKSKHWKKTEFPLTDVSGKVVGHITVMNDVSEFEINFDGNMFATAFIGGTILFFVFGLIFIIIKRMDASIINSRKDLEESEAQLRILFQDSPDAYLVLQDGIFSDCNTAAARMFGGDKSEIIGFSPAYFSPKYQPDGKLSTESASEKIADAIAVGYKTFEWLHKRINGDEFWVEVAINILRQKDRTNFLATCRDITQRKIAEQNLIISNRRLKDAQEVGNVGSWEFNFIENTLEWSEQTYRIYREGPQTFVPTFESVIAYYPDDDRQKVLDAFYKSVSNNEKLEIDHKILLKSGEIIFVHESGRMVYDKNGKPLRMTGCVVDITERKLTEIALQHERDQIKKNNIFQKLISEISSSFIKTNDETFDHDINTMLNRLGNHFGIDRSYLFTFSSDLKFMTNTHEWCANNISPQIQNIQNLPLDALPWWKDKICKQDFVLVEDVSLLSDEARNEKDEFERQEIKSLISVPIRSEKCLFGFIGFDSVRQVYRFNEGEIDGLKTIANIIADLVTKLNAKKENEKLEKNAFHSAKLASIGTLAAGVAHEINNPLAIASGYISILKNDLISSGNSTDQLEIKFNRIQKAFDRIVRIVNGLRNFARPDNNNIEKINVHNVIDETLSFSESIFTKNGIIITKDMKATDVEIDANNGKLQQVIMNFITNAKDAIDGTRIDGVIKLETYNLGNQIIIKFSDNGSGIKKENIKKIFDPLFTTKAPGKGTGLGLSITYSIIQEFGGKLDVESTVGIGTTFIISLPLANANRQIIKVVDDEQSPSIKLYGYALIAEDEEDLRKIIRTNLESVGLSVFEASDGAEALSMLDERKFDYLITDIQMPHVNGIELLTKIKQSNKFRDLHCIVITGGIVTDYSKEDREFIQMNTNGQITKPFSKNDLLKALV